MATKNYLKGLELLKQVNTKMMPFPETSTETIQELHKDYNAPYVIITHTEMEQTGQPISATEANLWLQGICEENNLIYSKSNANILITSISELNTVLYSIFTRAFGYDD